LLRLEVDLDRALEPEAGLGPDRAVRGDLLVDPDAPVPFQADEIEFRHSPIRWADPGPMSTRHWHLPRPAPRSARLAGRPQHVRGGEEERRLAPGRLGGIRGVD